MIVIVLWEKSLLASLFPALYSLSGKKSAQLLQSTWEWGAVSGLVANDQNMYFQFCVYSGIHNGGIILSLPPSAPCWTPWLLRLLNNCSTAGYTCCNLTPEIIKLPNVLVSVQVSHCGEFQELLVRHLREQETFEEEERKSTTKSSSPSRQRSAVSLWVVVLPGWTIRVLGQPRHCS